MRSGKQITVLRMKQILLERGRDGIKFHIELVAGRRTDSRLA